MIPSTYLEALTTYPRISTFQFQAIAKVTVVTKISQKTNDIDEQSVNTAHGSGIMKANLSYGNTYTKRKHGRHIVVLSSMRNKSQHNHVHRYEGARMKEQAAVNCDHGGGETDGGQMDTSSCTFYSLQATTEQT